MTTEQGGALFSTFSPQQIFNRCCYMFLFFNPKPRKFFNICYIVTILHLSPNIKAVKKRKKKKNGVQIFDIRCQVCHSDTSFLPFFGSSEHLLLLASPVVERNTHIKASIFLHIQANVVKSVRTENDQFLAKCKCSFLLFSVWSGFLILSQASPSRVFETRKSRASVIKNTQPLHKKVPKQLKK